jgi:hypothetical protein
VGDEQCATSVVSIPRCCLTISRGYVARLAFDRIELRAFFSSWMGCECVRLGAGGVVLCGPDRRGGRDGLWSIHIQVGKSHHQYCLSALVASFAVSAAGYIY